MADNNTKENENLKLKSISEILGYNFFIPSYQRGYRWGEQQVKDLLKDILEFASNKEMKGFYCLQPIVVKKETIETNEGKQDRYRVIDGQQRLTTIYIILKYLENLLEEEHDIETIYTILYETRQEECNDSYEFLEKIKNIDSVDNKNIDFHYMSSAYITIKKWFINSIKEKKITKRKFLETLMGTDTKDVKFIWYEIDDNEHEIDVFTRLNIGKIPLTNAELIKALFLQERNFGDGDIAKLKQLEIAQKWDRIENQMQEENFWWFLNKEENKSSSHIEFIFDMICNMSNVEDSIIGTDNNRTFRYYANLFGNNPDYDTIKKLWSEIEEKFETLQEWYSTHEWYHYIGFLIYSGKFVQEIMNWLNDKSIKTKENATTKLIDEIKKEFKNIKWKKSDSSKDSEKEQVFHIDLTYGANTEMLRKFFLLFNLEYINQQSSNENLIYYFPFKSFKVGKGNQESIAWDIEHVNSATENSLENFEDQKEWLKNAQQDILNIPEDLNNTIENFLTNSKSKDETKEKFESLQNSIIKLAKEHEIRDELKDCIGNLTLLDAGTNRGYGNSLFSTKRRIIIEKDREGTFIPLCTKNVFLKYFDGNIQSQWIEEDIEAYRNILEETMEKFLPIQEENNEI